MTNNIIADLSMEFSIKIVKLCDGIKGKSAIVNQLLRSGTSVGANIHEANYASSRADFIAKMQIALKECYETEYWLSLFAKTDIITQEQYKILKTDCGKIRKLLISSINTAKKMRKNWTHHFGEILCDVSNIFLFLRRIFKVKKIKMARGVTLTFEEGCNKYLENCRQRNLREGTPLRPFRGVEVYFSLDNNQKSGYTLISICL